MDNFGNKLSMGSKKLDFEAGKLGSGQYFFFKYFTQKLLAVNPYNAEGTFAQSTKTQKSLKNI